MKFRISWPVGIIMALASFIIFILYFVVKSFLPENAHHLVSEDYYKDEINYHSEMVKIENANKLPENVKLVEVESGLEIHFPTNFNPSQIKGSIKFQRSSEIEKDFNLPIELTSHVLHIENEKLIKGLWNVRIEWTVNNTEYLYKEKINF